MARTKGSKPVPTPPPPAKPERTPKVRRDWAPMFLEALATCGSVTKAAKAAGIDRTTAYDHYHRKPEFRQRWDDAIEAALDDAEDELRRRGVEGVEKPVYQGGVKVGTVREYSDTCLIFFLKGRRPKVWREPRGFIVNVPPGPETAHPDVASAAMAAADEAADRIEAEERDRAIESGGRVPPPGRAYGHD